MGKKNEFQAPMTDAFVRKLARVAVLAMHPKAMNPSIAEEIVFRAMRKELDAMKTPTEAPPGGDD